MILAQPPARHEFTELKVVLLSGLSDPSTCALSELQMRFLDALKTPAAAKVHRNFPYVECTTSHRVSPLWLASVRNAHQFAVAGRRAALARPHWRALADSANRIVVVTLSCGLEILNQMIDANDRHVKVIALGPVARRRATVPCTIVRGTRDPISRLFFRDADVVLPGVGHMSYLASPRVVEIVDAALH